MGKQEKNIINLFKNNIIKEEVITDIGEAKNLLQQQAIIRGAGEDKVFTSEDLAGLQTELPRDPETGEYVTGADFAKAIETGENIEMYDFDASGTLNQKDYEYSKHIAPHDIRVREIGTNKSRWETAKEHVVALLAEHE